MKYYLVYTFAVLLFHFSTRLGIKIWDCGLDLDEVTWKFANKIKFHKSSSSNTKYVPCINFILNHVSAVGFEIVYVCIQPLGDVVFRLFTILVFQMQIFDYLIRASNAASLFQSEKEDLHDIAVVSNSHCKEFINSLLISSSFLFRARAVVV